MVSGVAAPTTNAQGDAAVSSTDTVTSPYQCGSAAAGDVQGNAVGLTNGVDYTVAMAAEDDFGNTGPLSVPISA